jgi:hypothetical protein
MLISQLGIEASMQQGLRLELMAEGCYLVVSMEDVTSPDPHVLLTAASFLGTAGLGGKGEETPGGPIMNPLQPM